jgi:hypothetical protein
MMAEIHDMQEGVSLDLNNSRATHNCFKLFGYAFLTLVLDRYPRSLREILPICGQRRLPHNEERRAPGRRGRDGGGWGEYVHPS